MSRGTPFEAALLVLQRLKAHGHEAWIVGGAVRDHLLGLNAEQAQELDVTTDATPERIAEVFRRTMDVGKAFGVVRVLALGQWIEVATFRSDGPYSDGRRPDSVSFGTAQQDVQRRDFTVNAILWNPLEQKFLDLVGGMADLEQRKIRCIGDARERLREDGLRLLRAVRFGTQNGFTLTADTLEAVRCEGARLESVSAERIGDELSKIATREHSRRGDAALLLAESGLLQRVLPEAPLQSVCAAAAVLDRLQHRTVPLFLAALLQPAAWRPTTQLMQECETIATRLRLSRESMTTLQALVTARHRYRNPGGCSVARRHLLASRADAAWHEDLALAEQACADLARFREDWDRSGLRTRPEPLLDGRQLLQQGVKPGKAVGDWLRRVRWLQLEQRLHSPEDALLWLRQRGAINCA